MTTVGDRVELDYTSDRYTNLKRGDRGTVVLIDSLGITHVKWDNGSNLGMVPEAGDRFHVVEEGSWPTTTA